MVLGILSRKAEYRCKSLFSARNGCSCTYLCSCASSKHLQTRRFLDTLQGYLLDIQRILVALHLEVNARPAPFVDHAGILRDSKTGRAINGHAADEPGHESDDFFMRECLLRIKVYETDLTI